MDVDKYRFDGSRHFTARSVKPGDKSLCRDKAEGIKKLADNQRRMDEWQKRLFAEGRRALLVVFQAMDAAGKDGTIGKVFRLVNPEGIQVANFKAPSAEELAHDYLWRIHKEVPRRGQIGVFNRSHYEEVLVAKVESLPQKQKLPQNTLRGIWPTRYRQIRDFEQYLDENGVQVLKFYLHVSKQEQAKRFLARLDNPDKNWKFEAGDLQTRAAWDEYAKAYRDMVNNTATPRAPWYVVPADHKWYTHAVVSQVVADTLQAMRPAIPKTGEKQQKALKQYKSVLVAEQEGRC